MTVPAPATGRALATGTAQHSTMLMSSWSSCEIDARMRSLSASLFVKHWFVT